MLSPLIIDCRVVRIDVVTDGEAMGVAGVKNEIVVAADLVRVDEPLRLVPPALNLPYANVEGYIQRPQDDAALDVFCRRFSGLPGWGSVHAP